MQPSWINELEVWIHALPDSFANVKTRLVLARLAELITLVRRMNREKRGRDPLRHDI